MKQNYREWMETYLKGKPETELEMLFLEAGVRAKLSLFCSTLQSRGDHSWRPTALLLFPQQWAGWVPPWGIFCPSGLQPFTYCHHWQLHTHVAMNKCPALVHVQPDWFSISGAEGKELWDPKISPALYLLRTIFFRGLLKMIKLLIIDI